MRAAFWFPLLLLLLCVAGCMSSMAFIMTPRISSLLSEANLHFKVEDIRAAGGWSRAFGHGLEVEVHAARSAGDYKRDLDLEMEGAAEVCAALAMSDGILEWDHIDVRLFNHYGRIPPRLRNVDGVVRVVIRRETISVLRERNITASEYPRHWHFVHGFKEQPDSETLLHWRAAPSKAEP